jgi:hypothetical protein
LVAVTLIPVVSLKDRRRRPEGGEWEPIKIPRGNLAYIPKSTRIPSLLTRPRPSSYRRAIGLRNRTKNCSENMKQCRLAHHRNQQRRMRNELDWRPHRRVAERTASRAGDQMRPETKQNSARQRAPRDLAEDVFWSSTVTG